jgi:cytochrome P450
MQRPQPDVRKLGLPRVAQGVWAIFKPASFFLDMYPEGEETVEIELIPDIPVAISRNPDFIREIFTGNPDILYAGLGNRILRPIVGDYSVLLLDGARHKRDRKLMTPMFHGNQMRSYGPQIRKIVRDSLAQWPVNEEFAVHEQMQEITLDVILSTVFGVEESELPTFRDALIPFLDYGTNPLFLFVIGTDGTLHRPKMDKMLGPLGYFPKFERVRNNVYAMLQEQIEKFRAGEGNPESMLAQLISARFQDGMGLSDEEIRDELMTMLIAGHETTATSLSWTMGWFEQVPAVRYAIRAEIQEHWTDDGIDLDALGQLKYTFAALKESLRRNPVLPLVIRILQEDVEVAGRKYPKGFGLACSIYGMHHNPEIWEDPFAFRPERFLEHPGKPWHFLPFGGGHRTCLGMSFAYYEMKIAIAEIINRFDWQLADGYTPKMVRRNITLAPAKGMPIKVRPAG